MAAKCNFAILLLLFALAALISPASAEEASKEARKNDIVESASEREKRVRKFCAGKITSAFCRTCCEDIYFTLLHCFFFSITVPNH